MARALFEDRARLGQIDVHHVSELFLRVEGDSDRADAAFGADRLMLFAVAEILWVRFQIRFRLAQEPGDCRGGLNDESFV